MPKLAQRERKGPARSVVTSGDTLYDKLLQVALWFSKAEESIQKFESPASNLATKLEKIEGDLDTLDSDVSTVLYNADADEKVEETSFSIQGIIQEISEVRNDLEDVAAKSDMSENIEANAGFSFEEMESFVTQLVEEVKEVALATHGGTTSPIDLGDWLY